MAEIYGHLWISNYGASPNKAWCDMLGTLTTTEISYGVQLCKRETKIPNLPRFYELCKSMPDPNRFKPDLPKPKPDKAKVRAEIEKANALLDGGVKAFQQERERQERVKDLVWRQLHDPEYIAQMEERKAKMLKDWQEKLAEQEAMLNQN